MPEEFLPSSQQEAAAWGWDDSVGCDCHQFTSPDRSNVKYVSPDGKSEVIFSSDGSVVTASEDYGTYNFSSPLHDPIGHFYQDVVPWLIWGNDEIDSTNVSQRLEALFHPHRVSFRLIPAVGVLLRLYGSALGNTPV